MTPEQHRTPTNSFERPSARVAAAPVQRGNYGIPPRRPISQSNPLMPAAARSQSMDILPPKRQTPTPPTPPTPPPRPLYNTAPRPAIQQSIPNKPRGILPKLRLVMLVIAGLLLIAGLTRWATAGSTAGDIIAAGAVSANDGSVMTIQFTADDGQLHKFTNKSNASLIPGSAVQVAYRSGAADKSAKQVAPINAARSLAMSLIVAGSVLALLSGLATIIIRLSKPAAV